MAELGELKLLPKRVWRAAKRIGEERVEECREAATRYEELPLPAQRENPVAQVPAVACVQMDGGRFQERERIASQTPAPKTLAPENSESDIDSNNGGFWCEYKAGILMSMTSEEHAADPCPELPATFMDPGKMRGIAREIKGFTSESHVSIDAFGPLLANAAYERGFHAAKRKAFVADGSATNWGVWRKYFSHYTPILDFVHALMYVYAAAMAGRSANEGWAHYRDWAQWLWSGDVDRLRTALQGRQQELGIPEKNEKGTPRAQVASSLGYLTNQRERMKYNEYRKKGLPITSSPMESTVKQINRRINRRIKGTEKSWSDGADPMLHLVADRLSQTNVTANFWSRRLDRLIESASYHQAG